MQKSFVLELCVFVVDLRYCDALACRVSFLWNSDLVQVLAVFCWLEWNLTSWYKKQSVNAVSLSNPAKPGHKLISCTTIAVCDWYDDLCKCDHHVEVNSDAQVFYFWLEQEVQSEPQTRTDNFIFCTGVFHFAILSIQLITDISIETPPALLHSWCFSFLQVFF